MQEIRKKSEKPSFLATFDGYSGERYTGGRSGMGETDDPGLGVTTTYSSGEPGSLIQHKGNRGSVRLCRTGRQGPLEALRPCGVTQISLITPKINPAERGQEEPSK